MNGMIAHLEQDEWQGPWLYPFAESSVAIVTKMTTHMAKEVANYRFKAWCN